MKQYNTQGLFNIISGLLVGRRDNPQNQRTCQQCFICENCSGMGFFKSKRGRVDDCEVCKCSGRIILEFTVKQVPLEKKD